MMTDKDRLYIREGFRRIRDRLDRAESAEYDTAYHMLQRVRTDISNLRKTLRKANEGRPAAMHVRQEDTA